MKEPYHLAINVMPIKTPKSWLSDPKENRVQAESNIF